VKTWLMRGTVHLVSIDEISFYLAAIGPSAEREIFRWLKTMGLSPIAAQHLSDAISETIQAQPSTRRALADAVETRMGPWMREHVEHSWGGAVKLAAIQGNVCFGPPIGQEVTFVSRDAWLGQPAPPPDQNDALSWLLRKYLACYGPATPGDFSHRSGIPVSLARQIFAEAKLAPVILPFGPA
jgi:hypothetical protein